MATSFRYHIDRMKHCEIIKAPAMIYTAIIGEFIATTCSNAEDNIYLVIIILQ